MKIIFAGTPDFAARHLQGILDEAHHQVVAVYTQPDRPSGRGKKLTPSPVKALAERHNIPVYQPLSLRDEQAQLELARLNADIMVVVAYGLILPQVGLDTPRLGCINVHGSILPRWRGAAPIQRAVEAGDATSGVTIMQMDAGLDTGPMLKISECRLADDETSASLYEKLARLGVPALLESLHQLASGTATATAQDDAQSTYATKIDKSEAQIDWRAPASDIARKVRAFNPAPVAFTLLNGERLKIWLANALDQPANGAPGTIAATSGSGLLVNCGQGQLNITQAQLPGKARMEMAAILNGRAELFPLGGTLGN